MKQNPDVVMLHAAMQLIETGVEEYLCRAIWDTRPRTMPDGTKGPLGQIDDDAIDLAARVSQLFAPVEGLYYNSFSLKLMPKSFWLHAVDAEGDRVIREHDCKAWRLTALAFAAAMAETGDL